MRSLHRYRNRPAVPMGSVKRGGIRPGAGRKPLHGQRMVRKSVVLDLATVEAAQRLGDGSLSAGLRRAVAIFSDEPGLNRVMGARSLFE
jgi:hypothetical protein